MAYSPALLTDNSNRVTSGLGSTHKNLFVYGTIFSDWHRDEDFGKCETSEIQNEN